MVVAHRRGGFQPVGCTDETGSRGAGLSTVFPQLATPKPLKTGWKKPVEKPRKNTPKRLTRAGQRRDHHGRSNVHGPNAVPIVDSGYAWIRRVSQPEGEWVPVGGRGTSISVLGGWRESGLVRGRLRKPPSETMKDRFRSPAARMHMRPAQIRSVNFGLPGSDVHDPARLPLIR